jgi:predicted hydrocarbon binding protein
LFRSKKKEEEPLPGESPYNIDLENGTVTRKADGVRVAVLGSRGWALMEKELATTFITGAAVIFQRMGYSYGRAVARDMKVAMQAEPSAVFDVVGKVARESGWGRISLNSGDLAGGQAKIVVKDCYFCLHVRDATEPVCHILVGLVTGMADEVLQANHRAVEERCIAKGDAVCEVTIERT